MSKLSQNIIAIAAGIMVITSFALYIIFNAHHVTVSEGTIGALAGNLNNDGLFCESDGTVFFSNSYDEGCLYSMNPDQSDLKKLYNLNASYINAGGGYVFFHGKVIRQSTGLGSVVSKPGMYMVKSNGKKLKALTSDVTQSLLLYGNNIYYQHYNKTDGTTLAKMSLKNYKSEECLPFMINPSSVANGKIYYNGMYSDHHLYTYDLSSGEVLDIWGGDIWNPIYDNGYVYYMDVQNNYRLCRYSIADNIIEVITNDRLDSFNLYNGIIFYQKSSEKKPQLKRITVDGAGESVIADGVYNSICITSTYTYFKAFGDDYTTYYTPTFGSADVREFDAARDAMLKNMKK